MDAMFGEAIMKGMGYLGAGLCVGLGGLGPGIGEGLVASKALEGMARRPDQSGQLFKTMLIAMAVIESCAIYTLVIGLVLALK